MGKSLTLADVQWSRDPEQTDGAGGTVTRYTATASYTGTTSSYQYATGYTVTARLYRPGGQNRLQLC